MEITYTVKVTGYTDYWQNSSLTPPPYAELNNTIMTIRIESLPAISQFYDGSTFAVDILEYTKTVIVGPIEYVNGSELSSGNYLFLNTLVSQSLLPIGNWLFIDSLYPDEPDFGGYCDTYLASLGTHFMIGYRFYLIDAGNGWNAIVNMSTGLPINATFWASEYYRDPWYSYEVTLTPCNLE